MMFPFVSPYLHLMRNSGYRTPWDRMQDDVAGSRNRALGTPSWNVEADDADDATGSRPNGLGSDAFGGFGSREERRRALGSGLVSFGTNLLASAGSGDLAGGLARGASAFTETFGAERENSRRTQMAEREEARRDEEAERARNQDVRAAESHSLNLEAGREQLDDAKERRRIAAEIRTRTGKNASQMEADIQALAAQFPDNQKLQTMARRAAGYAVGDEDDVDKLTKLHDDMTNEAFWRQDYDREAGARRENLKADIGAGVASDPAAAERRANEELAISRGHLGVARERLTQDKSSTVKQMSLLQSFDRIQEIAEDKYYNKKVIFDEKMQRQPNPEEDAKLKAEALAEAQAEFRSLINSSYQFTADGRLIQ